MTEELNKILCRLKCFKVSEDTKIVSPFPSFLKIVKLSEISFAVTYKDAENFLTLDIDDISFNGFDSLISIDTSFSCRKGLYNLKPSNIEDFNELKSVLDECKHVIYLSLRLEIVGRDFFYAGLIQNASIEKIDLALDIVNVHDKTTLERFSSEHLEKKREERLRVASINRVKSNSKENVIRCIFCLCYSPRVEYIPHPYVGKKYDGTVIHMCNPCLDRWKIHRDQADRDGELILPGEINEEICCICSILPNELILCSSCPRSYCRTCLDRLLEADQLETMRKIEDWRCMACVQNDLPENPNVIKSCNGNKKKSQRTRIRNNSNSNINKAPSINTSFGDKNAINTAPLEPSSESAEGPRNPAKPLQFSMVRRSRSDPSSQSSRSDPHRKQKPFNCDETKLSEWREGDEERVSENDNDSDFDSDEYSHMHAYPIDFVLESVAHHDSESTADPSSGKCCVDVSLSVVGEATVEHQGNDSTTTALQNPENDSTTTGASETVSVVQTDGDAIPTAVIACSQAQSPQPLVTAVASDTFYFGQYVRCYEIECAQTNGQELLSTEDSCFLCKDGGELMECDCRRSRKRHNRHCRKVYHTDCLGYDVVENMKWFCPRHYCDCCAGDQLYFVCKYCPHSICGKESCLSRTDGMNFFRRYIPVKRIEKTNEFSSTEIPVICETCIHLIELGQKNGHVPPHWNPGIVKDIGSLLKTKGRSHKKKALSQETYYSNDDSDLIGSWNVLSTMLSPNKEGGGDANHSSRPHRDRRMSKKLALDQYLDLDAVPEREFRNKSPPYKPTFFRKNRHIAGPRNKRTERASLGRKDDESVYSDGQDDAAFIGCKGTETEAEDVVAGSVDEHSQLSNEINCNESVHVSIPYDDDANGIGNHNVARSERVSSLTMDVEISGDDSKSEGSRFVQSTSGCSNDEDMANLILGLRNTANECHVRPGAHRPDVAVQAVGKQGEGSASTLAEAVSSSDNNDFVSSPPAYSESTKNIHFSTNDKKTVYRQQGNVSATKQLKAEMSDNNFSLEKMIAVQTQWETNFTKLIKGSSVNNVSVLDASVIQPEQLSNQQSFPPLSVLTPYISNGTSTFASSIIKHPSVNQPASCSIHRSKPVAGPEKGEKRKYTKKKLDAHLPQNSHPVLPNPLAANGDRTVAVYEHSDNLGATNLDSSKHPRDGVSEKKKEKSLKRQRTPLAGDANSLMKEKSKNFKNSSLLTPSSVRPVSTGEFGMQTEKNLVSTLNTMTEGIKTVMCSPDAMTVQSESIRSCEHPLAIGRPFNDIAAYAQFPSSQYRPTTTIQNVIISSTSKTIPISDNGRSTINIQQEKQLADKETIQSIVTHGYPIRNGFFPPKGPIQYISNNPMSESFRSNHLYDIGGAHSSFGSERSTHAFMRPGRLSNKMPSEVLRNSMGNHAFNRSDNEFLANFPNYSVSSNAFVEEASTRIFPVTRTYFNQSSNTLDRLMYDDINEGGLLLPVFQASGTRYLPGETIPPSDLLLNDFTKSL